MTDPKGLITAYGYDLLGRTTVTIANWTGNVTMGPVDASSLPTPTDSANQTTEYTYDGDNNVISLTAVLPNNKFETTTYNYNYSGSSISDNDLLYQVQYPDPTTGAASSSQSETETYSYNALGEQTSYTDRNGTKHNYLYDPQGRITSDFVSSFGSGVDQSVSEIGYSYDDAGNIATATSYDSGGNVLNQVQETYDGFGQLAGDAQSHSGAVDDTTPTVSYGYDTSNGDRLSSMTYPSGRQINYSYNSGLDSTASRISSISDTNGTIQSYQYQGLDTPMVATSGNGVIGTTTLDTLGRISSLTYANSSGGVIDGFSYAYDADGNVLSKTNLVLSNDSETYGYDNLNRLTSFTRGSSTTDSWNYDALGNWKSNTLNGTTTTRTNNAQNQVTSVSGASSSLIYDANGNTLQDQTGQQYVYDAWNRLVTVKNASGTVIASYTYDALGRRITETENGATKDLYYSNRWQVIEEQQSGVTTAQYVWSPFYVDQMVERDDTPVTTDGVTTLTRRLYAEQDADYNVTSLTDLSGNIVERYVYDPYGSVTVMSASGTTITSGSTVGWIYGFQGGQRDPISGLVNFQRWDLNTGTGTWVQQDPEGYANGVDRYQFELSNSVASTDASGLRDVPTQELQDIQQLQAMQGQVWSPPEQPAPIPTPQPGGQVNPQQQGMPYGLGGDSRHTGFPMRNQPEQEEDDLEDEEKRLGGDSGSPADNMHTWLRRHPNARLNQSNSTPTPQTNGSGDGQKPPTTPASPADCGGDKPQDHHIATNKNSKAGQQWTKKFQPMFDKAGMSMDDPANRVFVEDHAGPHPDEYHNAIYQRLQDATNGLDGEAYKQALTKELQELGQEISTPGTYLNSLVTR